jgi:hypothetical protein
MIYVAWAISRSRSGRQAATAAIILPLTPSEGYIRDGGMS